MDMLPEQLSSGQPVEAVTGTVPESYTFVMNVWHLQDGASYTLAPGHQLRRASPEEITVIKKAVERLAGGRHAYYMYWWECRWPHTGGTVEMLPEGEWRYFVIAFRGSNRTMADLEAACNLAPLELEVGFTILYDPFGGTPGYGVASNPGRLFHLLEEAQGSDTFFLDVSAADVKAIATICSHLQQYDDRLIDVKRLVTQLSQLKGLPHRSPLRFLGYFAILESLLTHAPKSSDPYDSITRQVRKKVALLNNRWNPTIDYAPFRETPPETVWSKMYAYRSLLAHGGTPDFAGELAVLQNHERALKLVKDTVKAVIRQALTEPQLLLDLREC